MQDIIQAIKGKFSIVVVTIKRNKGNMIKLLPLISLVIPISILYFMDPRYFEKTWLGRTYELFFVWLCLLELILNWGEAGVTRIGKPKSARAIVFATFLLMPTAYVIIANFLGLNTLIYDLARSFNVTEHCALLMPLSTEYLIFMGLFVVIVLLGWGTRGVRDYSISILFLGVIGGVYTIDNLSPGGFAPFQVIVPTTTRLAANALSLMGYQTSISVGNSAEYGQLPYLFAQNSKGSAGFLIGWPCAGVESLLIYTVTILLFLSKSSIPWIQKAVYFVAGALVTYFINILRIATIFVIEINEGAAARQRFHDYYGQLYSIVWIVSYPLIIIGTRVLWTKARNWRTAQTKPM
jgi:exosortase/archaeosortase family protein